MRSLRSLFQYFSNLTSKASASAASEVIDVTFANILVKSNNNLTASMASKSKKPTSLTSEVTRGHFLMWTKVKTKIYENPSSLCSHDFCPLCYVFCSIGVYGVEGKSKLCVLSANFPSQCLKITQNVAFEFFQFLAISINFCLIQKWPVWKHCLTASFRFSKTRQNWPFLVFLMNFWPPKMSYLHFRILAFSTNFCPINSDLSGNTIWPQASSCQKLDKTDVFWHF